MSKFAPNCFKMHISYIVLKSLVIKSWTAIDIVKGGVSSTSCSKVFLIGIHDIVILLWDNPQYVWNLYSGLLLQFQELLIITKIET